MSRIIACNIVLPPVVVIVPVDKSSLPLITTPLIVFECKLDGCRLGLFCLLYTFSKHVISLNVFKQDVEPDVH